MTQDLALMVLSFILLLGLIRIIPYFESKIHEKCGWKTDTLIFSTMFFVDIVGIIFFISFLNVLKYILFL